MTDSAAKIGQYVDHCQEDMISFWRYLVNFQGCAKETARMTTLLQTVKSRLEQEGLLCRLIPSGEGIPVFAAVDGPERTGKPILLCGHLDTVFPRDAYPENPFVIRDGIAYGPGTADMKGGAVMMLYIVKTLRSIGFDRNPIKLLLCADEETGHVGSQTPEIIRQEAAGCLCAFNLETGRMDDCIAVGRKGNLDCHITVRGQGGHVGNDFLAGRNAIIEMAHKAIALQALSRYEEEGIIVSVDVIQGGTVSNAIPDFCKIEVDARFDRACDLERLKGQISEVCGVTYIEGTQTTVDFVNDMPVFEKTQANLDLLDQINQAAAEYECPPFGIAFPGGNSDVSYISQAGIPAVCACGVKGSGAHTMEECAIVDTLFQRTKIIACVITKLEEGMS
ncbi:M20 family peptidase [Pseudoflavonifractor sp. 60]|uniref:M20/M25/M40 family metallo-hydrolase n=1 Tax=Pseudoflavonifractor sp. 60 TaxID=2304576 RepID=UPI001368F386|nr:M20/M25/M40 family metallo-hydrolase [Pseudoflavonifractor sp. 60]NBI67603.1 M20 family peptidase [Pseudoflavonifractor sp. 60]